VDEGESSGYVEQLFDEVKDKRRSTRRVLRLSPKLKAVCDVLNYRLSARAAASHWLVSRGHASGARAADLTRFITLLGCASSRIHNGCAGTNDYPFFCSSPRRGSLARTPSMSR